MATAIGRTPLTLLTCQKVVVFFGTFVCTRKGYIERETYTLCYTSLEEEEALYRAHYALISQKWWFFWQIVMHQ